MSLFSVEQLALIDLIIKKQTVSSKVIIKLLAHIFNLSEINSFSISSLSFPPHDFYFSSELSRTIKLISFQRGKKYFNLLILES